MPSSKTTFAVPPRGVFRRFFQHDGHRYEVILDVGPPWDGLVHVLDAEMPPDPDHLTDCVFTGARWDRRTGAASWNDAKALRSGARALLEPAVDCLRVALKE